MQIQIGRNNLSATIYTPVDCNNNCKFCTSKNEYKNINKEKVMEQLKFISSSQIQEIVITGGEVMNDVDTLRDMVNIVSNKTVYINTTYINNNLYKFVELVNSKDNIKGINISRHSTSYDEDCKLLHNIAQDEFIRFIKNQ